MTVVDAFRSLIGRLSAGESKLPSAPQVFDSRPKDLDDPFHANDVQFQVGEMLSKLAKSRETAGER